MRTPLRNQFITQIEALLGFDFQEFVNELFLKIYGGNFISFRRVRDRGADGIIVITSTVVACYAPKKYDKTPFENKADEDFNSYRTNWETSYPNWMMIVNHAVVPDQLQKVQSLKAGSVVHGTDYLINEIERLSGAKRRNIGEYLRIDKDYFAKDYIKEIVEDLLEKNIDFTNPMRFRQGINIQDKIELNYKKRQVEGALEQYQEVILCFTDIEEIIRSYSDEEKERLKYRVISDFNAKKGSFKNKLDSLTNDYLEKYVGQDDDYRFYIQAILFYLFEQCLIGKKVKGENVTATP